jgi:hypothetical protein
LRSKLSVYVVLEWPGQQSEWFDSGLLTSQDYKVTVARPCDLVANKNIDREKELREREREERRGEERRGEGERGRKAQREGKQSSEP